jgi:hypothetical protein
MSENPFSLWVYLSQSPLLWLTVTLLVYAITDAVSLKTQRNPFANPVLHSMWIIGAFLLLTGTSYTTYFAGAQFVHFLLGPATEWALRISAPAGSRLASRRTVSVPPARFRSTPSQACSPASP